MTQERPPFFSKGQNGLKVEGRFQLLKLKNDVSAGKKSAFLTCFRYKKGPTISHIVNKKVVQLETTFTPK